MTSSTPAVLPATRRRLKAELHAAMVETGTEDAALAAALRVSPRIVARWRSRLGEAPPVPRYIQAAKVMRRPEMLAPLIEDAGWQVCDPDHVLSRRMAALSRSVEEAVEILAAALKAARGS